MISGNNSAGRSCHSDRHGINPTARTETPIVRTPPVTAVADDGLDWLLEDVAAGRVSSALLTGPIYRAYVIGYAKADAAAEPTISFLKQQVAHLERLLARAEADADCYYERWLNPGLRLSEVRQRRIEQALASAEADHEPLTVERQVALTVQASMPPRRQAA